MSINHIRLRPVIFFQRTSLFIIFYQNIIKSLPLINFIKDVIQQQQNFSPKFRCLFLAMMKFIEHAAIQATKLNQLVYIAR